MPGHYHASGQCGAEGGNNFGTAGDAYKNTQDTGANQTANEDLQRANFYQERFDLHEEGRLIAQTEWRLGVSLKQDVLRVALQLSPEEVEFMQDALTQLADARRSLKWTFAYAYFSEKVLTPEKFQFLKFLQGKLQDEIEFFVYLLDPADVGGQSSKVVSRGRLELVSYKKRVVAQTTKVQGLMKDMVRYFDSGMNDELTIGGQTEGPSGATIIPPGKWKCDNCPMVNRISQRRCPSCKAWRPR